VTRLLEDFVVPFDDDEAGRDPRMMKAEQQISDGFRAPTGATTLCTLAATSSPRARRAAPRRMRSAICSPATPPSPQCPNSCHARQ
jgi:hypothetical protein